MNTPPCDGSLWSLTAQGGDLARRHLHGLDASVALDELAGGSSLDRPVGDLAGKSVLIATTDQLTAALAAIELDGIARRVVLCPPDLSPDHLPHVRTTAGIDAVVSDGRMPSDVVCSATIMPGSPVRLPRRETEWVLLTSGTTGAPKLVVHTLSSLVGAIKPNSFTAAAGSVWSTFYDIRRYGGLQVFLRAALGGGSLVLSSAKEPVADFLARVGRHGVSHISGTPSHWRRALMSPAAGLMAPKYVRLSGEIADQAILDDLRAFYRDASVAHAFASTEAGVGFTVDDGMAGFPASLVGQGAEVEMKIADGSLRIRSSRTASRYLGDVGPLRDADGFVDNGDELELRDGRYYFVGRRGGIINVGGLKVHPEEVEAVINRHPAVRMSLVKARKNPFTGAVVVAEVVARQEPSDALQGEIIAACRGTLAPHKVPAAIRFVPVLTVGGPGKLARAAQ
ncbi:MAG TPA: AMP-binding protein [Stellaceae bacterium]|jgi:acyl-coenzyme A synthetase/AMP-(fatty) acid ligase|nr:AMP-binding protein [Stellaceae bacterium]